MHGLVLLIPDKPDEERDVSHAAVFASVAAGALALPRTCVVDVGLLENGQWVVVECNATWGAGLNGCEAAEVVDCIDAAVVDSDEFDIAPDGAFDLTQEVLAGRRRVRLNGGSSKVMRVLFSYDTDTHITKQKLATRLGVERRFPVEYIREAGPAVFSAVMESACVKKVDSATLLQLPASTVPAVQRFPAWSYESKSIWILPGDGEIVFIVRSANPEATEPSAAPAPRDGPLAPRLLAPWEPEPARFHTFDSARDCPHCGEASKSYREYRDCLVCTACGRSFTLADNAKSSRT